MRAPATVRDLHEKVFIFGDYDLDGVTSVTLLSRGLGEIGVETEWRLPNRFGDGYGLSMSAVDEMYEAGARYVITVDTGITANEEIAHAKELGMAVMVMDHHQPSGEGLPTCDVLLDPHQEGDTYPNPELCGVGVSYKFMCALYAKLADERPAAAEDMRLVQDFLPRLRGEKRDGKADCKRQEESRDARRERKACDESDHCGKCRERPERREDRRAESACLAQRERRAERKPFEPMCN